MREGDSRRALGTELERDGLVAARCHADVPAWPGKTVILAVQLMKQVITPHTAKMVGCT
jgi:hypothetical protein